MTRKQFGGQYQDGRFAGTRLYHNVAAPEMCHLAFADHGDGPMVRPVPHSLAKIRWYTSGLGAMERLAGGETGRKIVLCKGAGVRSNENW